MGVSSNQVRIHGALPAVYVYASNHLVHPIVAWSDHTLQYQINEHEVDEVLRFALDTSRPNVAIQRRNVNRRGAMILTPALKWTGILCGEQPPSFSAASSIAWVFRPFSKIKCLIENRS